MRSFLFFIFLVGWGNWEEPVERKGRRRWRKRRVISGRNRCGCRWSWWDARAPAGTHCRLVLPRIREIAHLRMPLLRFWSRSSRFWWRTLGPFPLSLSRPRTSITSLPVIDQLVLNKTHKNKWNASVWSEKVLLEK